MLFLDVSWNLLSDNPEIFVDIKFSIEKKMEKYSSLNKMKTPF